MVDQLAPGKAGGGASRRVSDAATMRSWSRGGGSPARPPPERLSIASPRAALERKRAHAVFGAAGLIASHVTRLQAAGFHRWLELLHEPPQPPPLSPRRRVSSHNGQQHQPQQQQQQPDGGGAAGNGKAAPDLHLVGAGHMQAHLELSMQSLERANVELFQMKRGAFGEGAGGRALLFGVRRTAALSRARDTFERHD